MNTQSPAPGVATEITREQFERWAVENGMHDLSYLGTGPDRRYLRDPTNICWEAWQTCAALQANAAAGEPVGNWLGMGSHARQRYYEVHGEQLPDDTLLYTAPPPAQPATQEAQEARRYRALRDGGSHDFRIMEFTVEGGFHQVFGKPETVDALIDKAIEAAGPSPAVPRAEEAAQPAGVTDAPVMQSDIEIALIEGHCIPSCDSYFDARPPMDNKENRRLFEAGFSRGWRASNIAHPAGVERDVPDMQGLIEWLRLEADNHTPAKGPMSDAEMLRTWADRVAALAHNAAPKSGESGVVPVRALPRPGSPEASAMLDSLLAEYNYPSNTKNAARAGWEAASRWLSAAPHPVAAPQAVGEIDARHLKDAARWRAFERVLRSGHIPGAGHGRRIKIIETCSQFGDEKEVTDLVAEIDRLTTTNNSAPASAGKEE